MEKRRSGLPVRIIALVAVLLLVNAFLGFSLAQEAKRAMTEQIHDRMLDIACSAAELLDGDSLASFTAEDQGAPEYEKAMSTLRAFQDNVNLSYIYCVREVGDQAFEFTVDPTVGDPADFGEPVEFTDALGKASEGVASVDLVSYNDRWGRFYSAYCPVFDSKGEVASVVGVDFAASWYEDRADSINRMAIVSGFASLVLALIAIVMIARMSRAEVEHVESLLKANQYDSLTGLANMGHFLELANTSYQEMTAKGEEPAMLYMNLVGMRFFNQKRGFAEGDKLLKAFADLLREYFGQDRCGRFGRDHFAVSTNAEGLDARLDAFIEECANINGGKSLPVHIGVHLDSLGQENASIACDYAKAASEENLVANRSSYCYFSADMMTRVEQRQYIVEHIDRAIDEGWIKVFYQPIVRSSTGKVCDEEALARWDDPKRGLLSPAEFIPVLEDAKLVYKLDLNVLEQTLNKMKRMGDEGLYVVSASVNLSRSDFEVCDMVEEVRERVDASGIDRAKINIEITESALGMDFEFMKEQVKRFHELGFQVWMDDFGSEYSSLDYLQSLHFDLLKLDMRFMQRFDSNSKSKVILTELVRMALGLGVDTVAEGVETQEQVDFLREVGCSKLQGFFFTKPLPVEDVLRRYETGTAIGFENPAEAEYYSALGCANLYDLSSIVRGDDEGLGHYFDTLPMAVVECTDEGFAIVRCNQSYHRFIEGSFGDGRIGERVPFAQFDEAGDSPFIQAIRACGEDGNLHIFDEVMADGLVAHALVRRIATNPVNGAIAVIVAVLTIAKG